MKSVILCLTLFSALCWAGYQSAYSGFFALPKEVAVERNMGWKPLSFSVYGFSHSVIFNLASKLPVTAGIDIHAVSGKKVKSLTVSIKGEGRTVWNLTDHYGRPVAPGVYIARLNNSVFPVSRIFVVLR